MSRELLCKKCAIQAHFSFNQEPAATRYAVLAAGSALNESQASPGFLQGKLTPLASRASRRGRRDGPRFGTGVIKLSLYRLSP